MDLQDGNLEVECVDTSPNIDVLQRNQKNERIKE